MLIDRQMQILNEFFEIVWSPRENKKEIAKNSFEKWKKLNVLGDLSETLMNPLSTTHARMLFNQAFSLCSTKPLCSFLVCDRSTRMLKRSTTEKDFSLKRCAMCCRCIFPVSGESLKDDALFQNHEFVKPLRQDPLIWVFGHFDVLHHGIEEVERHLLWKFHKKGIVGQMCHQSCSLALGFYTKLYTKMAISEVQSRSGHWI